MLQSDKNCKMRKHLTPWNSAIEKSVFPQLVKEFPACCGILRFITEFTTVFYLSLSCARLSSARSVMLFLKAYFPSFRSFQSICPIPTFLKTFCNIFLRLRFC